MAALHPISANRFDVVVVGGGHNGLVAAAYLGKAGLRVAVAEARDRLGGPCGTFEFLPGYRTAFSNSPGSLEPRVVDELDLPRFGLRFVRPEITVVHHFPGRPFLGWRDRARVDAQLDALIAGEAGRYHALLGALEDLARAMRVSIFEPAPPIEEIERRLERDQDRRLFDRVFRGSLRELLEGTLRSAEARAALGMVGIAGNLAPSSACGTAAGLMLRPMSLASGPAYGPDDPRRVALRGSTGLAVGGMGAIVDALAACCRAHGVTLRTGARTARILHRRGAASGVVLAGGEELSAPIVVSSVHPRIAFGQLLDHGAIDPTLRQEIAAKPTRGSMFKIVLALDGVPQYASLPEGLDKAVAAASQFRVADSLDRVDEAVGDALAGAPSRRPMMWGLIPSLTSPGMAPEGRHLMSVNVCHAPYRLVSGSWATERDRFGKHCVAILGEMMPDLERRIVGHRFMSPIELEAELGLIEANITHGDMLADQLFGTRPHSRCSDYRTPLKGLYLTGAGTWPGGYVTGVPGRNAGRAVLEDLKRARAAPVREAVWNS